MTALRSTRRFLIPSEHNLKPGEFYNILITESTDFDLYGKPFETQLRYSEILTTESHCDYIVSLSYTVK